MSRSGQPPDLKKYMDKKLQIKLNANRMIIGTLRGFDQFMNLVVDNTVEVNGNEKTDIGMVVIRGNSVVTVEALEPVNRTQLIRLKALEKTGISIQMTPIVNRRSLVYCQQISRTFMHPILNFSMSEKYSDF